jgi:hypothetical protein
MIDARLKEIPGGPNETTVEFSLGFDIKGKATLVPALLSSEAAASAAVKVTAKWTTPNA